MPGRHGLARCNRLAARRFPLVPSPACVTRPGRSRSAASREKEQREVVGLRGPRTGDSAWYVTSTVRSRLGCGRDDAGVVVPYPPPPWRLAGRLVVAFAPLRVDVARALVPAPLVLLPVWRGRALAMLIVGVYGKGSTLRYGEVAGVVGPVRAGARPGGLVTSIWVDDERSLAGGRQVWGLPKQRATLRWRAGALEAYDAAGAPIVRARWREPRVHMPVPAAAPFIAVLDGTVRRAWLTGRLDLAPTRVELDIPAGSPLARLALTGDCLALTGRLDVRVRAPVNVPIQ
jgi:acetoacetate decarboxylase